MEIQVLVNFGGVETGEKRILPGVYHHNDPALFGLAVYLVKNGHAKVVTDSDGRMINDPIAGAMALGELIAEERMVAKAVGAPVVTKLSFPPDEITTTELIAENLETLKDGDEVVVNFDQSAAVIDDTEIVVDEPTTVTSIHGLGLPSQVLKSLSDAGIQTVEQIATMDDDELLAIDGIGHTTVRKLRSLTDK